MDIEDKIKPYKKHNIYTTKYKVVKNKFIVPKSAKWIVLKYLGYSPPYGNFIKEKLKDKEDILALILDDETNNFWTVISFLTKDEAKELCSQLTAILEGNET